ncbi:MAG: hypothetical protein P1P88_16230 [Bacteroidales bacterium]|nr:hypothetical protein [Bacteroidales bacterium]
MHNKLLIEEFKEYFKMKKEILQSDIFKFYSGYEPEISKELVRKRTENIIKQGILKKVGKGVYALGNETNYQPELDPFIKKLYKKLNKEYPVVKFCLWNTKQLNEFMLHQPGRFYTIVETENELSEYVFNYLKDFNKEVYHSTDKDIIQKYASFSFNSIIVKDLTTEAPIQQVENIPSATLEKILVDIFCDDDLFIAHQGSELEMIFRTSFEKYTVNKSKLFRYAARRNKKEQIIDFLNNLNSL